MDKIEIRKRNLLAEVINDPNAVFFLGAGASYGSGLPLGDEAAVSIIKNIFISTNYYDKWEKLQLLNKAEQPIPWPRFEVVCSALAQYFTDMPNGVLASFNNVGMTMIHKFLIKTSILPKLWLTTNFDNILERSMDELGVNYKVISNKKNIQKALNEKLHTHVIVKLHGDVNSLSSNEDQDIGLEIDHILREMPNSVSTPIIEFCKQKNILFIGYAARDPDLAHMLSEITKVSEIIAWIGFGDAPKPVKELLSNCLSMYYRNGSFYELQPYIQKTNFTDYAEEGKWEKNIQRWLDSKSKDDLRLSLAEILYARGGHESITECLSILRDIININSNIRFLEIYSQYVSEYESSLASEYELEILFNKLTNDEVPLEIRIRALLSFSQKLWHNGKLEDALKLSEKAGEYSKAKLPTLFINSLIQQGNILTFIGSERKDEAIKRLNLAIKEANSFGKKRLEAESALRLAVTHMRFNQPSYSETILRDNEKIFMEIGSPRNIAVWKLNLAESLRIQGKFIEAIEVNKSVLTMAKLIGNREISYKAGCNIGLCYLIKIQFKEAEKNFLDSFKISWKSNDIESAANCLYNLGWLRTILFFWDEAIDFFIKASEIYAKSKYLEREGGALSYMGICYLFLGRIEKASDILNLIHQKKVIPYGLYKPIYKILLLGINCKHDFLNGFNKLDEEFCNDDPEYKIYYLILLLHLHTPKPFIIEKLERELKLCQEYDFIHFFVYRALSSLGYLTKERKLKFLKELFWEESLTDIQKRKCSDFQCSTEIN